MNTLCPAGVLGQQAQHFITWGRVRNAGPHRTRNLHWNGRPCPTVWLPRRAELENDAWKHHFPIRVPHLLTLLSSISCPLFLLKYRLVFVSLTPTCRLGFWAVGVGANWGLGVRLFQDLGL